MGSRLWAFDFRLQRPTPNAQRPTPNAQRPTPNAQRLSPRLQQRRGALAHQLVRITRCLCQQRVGGGAELSESLDHEVADIHELGAELPLQEWQSRLGGRWSD